MRKSAGIADTAAIDTSEEAKTVKGWRATLQKAFLTKGVPSAEVSSTCDDTILDEFYTQY